MGGCCWCVDDDMEGGETEEGEAPALVTLPPEMEEACDRPPVSLLALPFM